MEPEANPNRFKELILSAFPNDLAEKKVSYPELMFLLDERAQNLECDRVIARELFLQSSPLNTTTTLERIVERYVDNLNTCRLCEVRQKIALTSLQDKLKAVITQREQMIATPYAFITVERAVMHAHFSPSPNFAYKIEPSSLPPVTFVNETNIEINDSYTLELPDKYFELVFLESGIEMIERYRFTAVGKRSGEEYHETFNQKGLEVSLRVKYYDKMQELDEHIEQLRVELQRKEHQLEIAKRAYIRLKEFEPFGLQYRKARRLEQRINQTGCLFSCSEWLLFALPCLRNHVRNYYYWSILVILVQAAASLYCPIPMLNMALPFYMLGVIYTGTEHISRRLWLVILVQLFLIGNSVVGCVLPLHHGSTRYRQLMVIDIAVESISLVLLWIMAMRSNEFDFQSSSLLSNPPA